MPGPNNLLNSLYNQVNMDPWDLGSIYYEDRAESIVGGQLDAMEATSNFQSEMIRDKIADRKASRKVKQSKNNLNRRLELRETISTLRSQLSELRNDLDEAVPADKPEIEEDIADIKADIAYYRNELKNLPKA